MAGCEGAEQDVLHLSPPPVEDSGCFSIDLPSPGPGFDYLSDRTESIVGNNSDDEFGTDFSSIRKRSE